MTKTTDKILNLMLMDGIVLTALGICAILLPNLMSFTTSIILSIILTIFGVYKFINTIMMRKEIKNPYLSAIIGLLIISAGIYLFFHPIFNLLLLTILIALYFILESINSIYLTFENRGIVRYWWTGFFMAAIQLFLGIFILISLPFSSLWLLGTLLGISFLINGILTIVMFTSSKMIESEL